ncbi:MAG: hypothetical protein IJW48_04390 [Clostridia bacterium]|nr:hypothetical protein [Clostridia bacterium]
MVIHTYEAGGRGEACAEYLRAHESELSATHALILPIPTTRDNLHLNGSDVLLSDIIKTAGPGMLVIGYGMPRSFRDALTSLGASVFDAGDDELFLLKNAELTALAALGILLTTERCAISDISFGIVGYGRIGRKLARMLLFHGAEVRIYTSRDATRLELGGLGVAASVSARDADFGGIDILINTAPAVIFKDGVPPEIRVIDLASGDNFPGREVERYPSVPAKMFPRSAGLALGSAAVRYFREEGSSR